MHLQLANVSAIPSTTRVGQTRGRRRTSSAHSPLAQQMTRRGSALHGRRKSEGGAVARETKETVAREMRHHQEPRLPAGGAVGVGRGLAVAPRSPVASDALHKPPHRRARCTGARPAGRARAHKAVLRAPRLPRPLPGAPLWPCRGPLGTWQASQGHLGRGEQPREEEPGKDAKQDDRR